MNDLMKKHLDGTCDIFSSSASDPSTPSATATDPSASQDAPPGPGSTTHPAEKKGKE